MDAYLAEHPARAHAEQLMADAATSHRASRARQARRARADARRARRAAQRRRLSPVPAMTARWIARPFLALHAWYAAGQL